MQLGGLLLFPFAIHFVFRVAANPVLGLGWN